MKIAQGKKRNPVPMFYGTTCSELENFLILLCHQIDCLLKHLQRANYQAAVWKQSTSCSIDAPSPVNHGWKLNQEGKISIQWMDGNCAPDALLANCDCKCIKKQVVQPNRAPAKKP